MRENRGAFAGVADIAGDVAAGERAPGVAQLLVAADVIGCRVRY